MKGVLIWLFGTAGAFLITAGVFLLLANLGSNASESSLETPTATSNPRAPLQLNIDRARLGSLEAFEDQELAVVVRNGSDNSFSKVSLTLRVSSEDTTLTRARYYRAEVSRLREEKSESVPFTLDLSPLAGLPENEARLPGDLIRNRVVLEIQATTPEGISTVKTAVLPFSDDGSS